VSASFKRWGAEVDHHLMAAWRRSRSQLREQPFCAPRSTFAPALARSLLRQRACAAHDSGSMWFAIPSIHAERGYSKDSST
jgi:hypothetical protein